MIQADFTKCETEVCMFTLYLSALYFFMIIYWHYLFTIILGP